MRTLTWTEVRGRRLARSYLLRPAPRGRLAPVVGDVCGLQAQVLTAAELALGVRVVGATREGVREALWEARTLVKTYGPRGTLHLFPSRELGLWAAAMAAVASLDRANPGELAEGIHETLRGGRELTREELAREVGKRLGKAAREQLSDTWGRGLARAAWSGGLCFGRNRGAKVTFVRPEEWLGKVATWDADAALREVARRYVRAYGPVSARDFARWTLLDARRAAALFDALGSELVEVDVEGARAWVLRTDARRAWRDAAEAVSLVPQYDAYALGSHPRESILPESSRRRVFAHGRGRFEGAVALPLLLVGGEVRGMWEGKVRGARLGVRIECFARLAGAGPGRVEEEAGRIAAFQGRVLDLSFGRLSRSGR